MSLKLTEYHGQHGLGDREQLTTLMRNAKMLTSLVVVSNSDSRLMVEVQIGLICGLNMEIKHQLSLKLTKICLTLAMMSLPGVDIVFVIGKEVNVLSVVMIDACGAGQQRSHKAGRLSLLHVDAILMHTNIVREREEHGSVVVAKMSEPQLVIGAGLGMMKKNGNLNMQPLDVNLPKFDSREYYLEKRTLRELP